MGRAPRDASAKRRDLGEIVRGRRRSRERTLRVKRPFGVTSDLAHGVETMGSNVGVGLLKPEVGGQRGQFHQEVWTSEGSVGPPKVQCWE